ncbi:hypothetical protein GCM10011517_07620 [Actibacterium pelagium]|uniref:PAS domain-containing protein n=2 Tax=Actibacterium pelagium TaxID=2029103 RepID=A0A917ACE7_9RHOB|nr:hypothetical protein GCM10011517_07620 [Actibacterium pelagium]
MQYRNAEHFHLLNEVESYWEALRDGASAPFRDQIDPRGLERALDNVFYIEKLGAGAVRFRLAGKVVEQLIGMDPRSMPFVSLFDGADRTAARNLVENAFERPQVVRMRLFSKGPNGQSKFNLSGGLILLPLKDAKGSVRRALGCLQVEKKDAPSMRNFTIQTVTTRNLAPLEKRPEKMPPLIEEAFTEFNEDPAKFDHKPAKTDVTPFLRVVKS